jgi:uncharacterized protein YigA (DUF484 family)
MSTSPVRGLKAEAALNDGSVAEYLQSAPDFFERNRQLLDKLRLPHGRREGATISLVERQVELLRERNESAERKLRDLIEVARVNDQLTDRIHRLSLRLLGARSREECVAAIETSLREDFEAMHTVLMLFVDEAEEVGEDSRFVRMATREGAEAKMFEALLESGKPRCGQIRDTQRDYLFGKDTIEIGSVALTPLGPRGSLGILAIGASDSQRFNPGMSTEFLARIGELVSCALRR